MFRTIVQFTVPLNELDQQTFQTFESLSTDYNQHSSLISLPQISVPGSGDIVERTWQDESLADAYIASLATYTDKLTITKIAE